MAENPRAEKIKKIAPNFQTNTEIQSMKNKLRDNKMLMFTFSSHDHLTQNWILSLNQLDIKVRLQEQQNGIIVTTTHILQRYDSKRMENPSNI